MGTAGAFEMRGRRALARLGGRLALIYLVGTAIGVVAGAGWSGVPVALQLSGLGMLAGLLIAGTDLLVPTSGGRHASSAGSRLLRLGRGALPHLIAVLVAACGVLALWRLCALAPTLGWPHVHTLAGWLIPGFGIGLALAGGTAWGLAGLAVLWAGLRTFASGDGAAAVPGTVAGASITVLVGIIIHVGARRGFRATERADRAALEAERAHRLAEQRLVARRRIDRMLHDTVLGTLTLLAHAGVGVRPWDVRAACRRDLALLRSDRWDVDADSSLLADDSPDALDVVAVTDGGPTTVAALGAGAGLPQPREIDLTDASARAGEVGAEPALPPGVDYLAGRLTALRELAARRGVDLRVHVQTTSPPGSAPSAGADPPDRAVLDAWSGALTECVANIARHADVAAADVVLGRTDDVLVTVVVDEGIGFAPEEVAAERLGLSGSVRERVAEAGGQARVWSRPGQGTVVELLLPWPRRTPPHGGSGSS